ncbi:MAG: acyl-CoA thioesterase [Rhodothermales bacterium]
MREKQAIRVFEYRHIVGFEETNLVGNVYYVNHLRWQGRCRELFLREHAPDVLDSLEKDFALVTVSVSCEYLDELRAFDEVIIRMHLDALTQNRMTLGFSYHRQEPDGVTLIARGKQVIACMRRQGGHLIPTPVPVGLREALHLYDPVKAMP